MRTMNFMNKQSKSNFFFGCHFIIFSFTLGTLDAINNLALNQRHRGINKLMLHPPRFFVAESSESGKMKKGPLLSNISYLIWACIANRFISIVWQRERRVELKKTAFPACYLYYHIFFMLIYELGEILVQWSPVWSSVVARYGRFLIW